MTARENTECYAIERTTTLALHISTYGIMRNSLDLLDSCAPLLLPEFIRVDDNVPRLRVGERQPLACQTTPAVDPQVVRVSDGSAVEPLDPPPAARHTPHEHCVRLRLRVPLAAEEEAAVTPHESVAAVDAAQQLQREWRAVPHLQNAHSQSPTPSRREEWRRRTRRT